MHISHIVCQVKGKHVIHYVFFLTLATLCLSDALKEELKGLFNVTYILQIYVDNYFPYL